MSHASLCFSSATLHGWLWAVYGCTHCGGEPAHPPTGTSHLPCVPPRRACAVPVLAGPCVPCWYATDRQVCTVWTACLLGSLAPALSCLCVALTPYPCAAPGSCPAGHKGPHLSLNLTLPYRPPAHRLLPSPLPLQHLAEKYNVKDGFGWFTSCLMFALGCGTCLLAQELNHIKSVELAGGLQPTVATTMIIPGQQVMGAAPSYHK